MDWCMIFTISLMFNNINAEHQTEEINNSPQFTQMKDKEWTAGFI